MKLVTQEHPMGCGVACIATVSKVEYKKALSYLNPEHASRRGYYLRELQLALKKLGLEYDYAKYSIKTQTFT
ncbi:MAG: cysteine peptidase family C39 domain-containing protein [Candidatus Woesearchaeota archaeon]